MRSLLIILLLAPLTIKAQNSALLHEQQLKGAYQKAYPACVKAYGVDSSTRMQNSAQFSAVVVSADGILLTVAHAVVPGNLYKISFPDGSITYARALGRIVTDRQSMRPDIAMMQITESGPWPFVELGYSGTLTPGQSCFGISYPESQNLPKPMLRIGQILNSLNKWGFIESSCIMETGDSGGPLFDLEGKLIGLHSRIDKPEGANYEVPVDSYRKYFTALKLVKNYDSLPQQSDPVLGNERSSAHHSQRFKATAPVVLAKVKSRIEGAVVAIYGSRDTIAGTVFQLKNGRQIIISKSSEVGDTVFIDVNGRFIPLNILRRDKRKDLVALSSSYRFLQPVMINQLKPVRGGDSGWTGRFLYSVLPDGTLKSSVAGLIVKDLPNRFSSGGFDAFLQERNGCPTITQTDAGGVAEKAGLKTGDCIFQINNIPVNGAKDFNREMMKYYPGDSIRFSVKRQEDTLNAGLVLVPRMLREQPHPMNHFKGGKSIRRDGFQHVILHDARLRSYECGSPLFNLEGNLTGINIARFSHTTTLALELSELLDFIETIGL